MEHIKGPDFPTAGIICGQNWNNGAYNTGRGIITLRSKHTLKKIKKEKP